MTALPNPFVFNSAETTADTAVVSELLPPGATAVTYSPEPFSEYAAQRSSPIVSPPLPRPPRELYRDLMEALFEQIKDPADQAPFDGPPPTFLSNPDLAFDGERTVSPRLMKELYEIAGLRTE